MLFLESYDWAHDSNCLVSIDNGFRLFLQLNVDDK
jgi:hypothetical protein